ncbi:MAG: hypothetical protein DRH08_06585 [Deltaproteobacteria bacterium]|nr:MAG: hypothetical protein DRH08_06585 [Deltaproteobacteria bacterium]
MSSRGIAVLDRNLRGIDDAARIRVEARCETLRLDLALVLPDQGPFTAHEPLVVMVNDAADDIAVIGQDSMGQAYSESLTSLRRELNGLLSTVGRTDLKDEVLGNLYRAGLFHEWIGVQSEYITTTTDRVIVEADRQWELSLRYDDDWSSRLVAPGRVGVIGRRGRSLFSTYPGLLRVAFIDNMWAMVNEDRLTFGDVLEAALG